jgi:tRNA (guanine-N7-)-methyltransferase
MPSIADVIVEPPQPDERWDPRELFASDGPIELEIGSGKGGFLLQQALANPDIGYVGIEWANKYFRYAADRMVRRGIPNVRLMRTDARQLFLRNVPAECLQALHIYHPDPWPKKRHHKRRLIQPDFLEAVVRALVPDGSLFIQTDHADYFAWICDVMTKEPRLVDVVEDSIAEGSVDRVLVETNFQIKYEREGRSFFSLIKKKALSAQ